MKTYLWIVMVIFGWWLSSVLFPVARDDTDPPGGHSGVAIYRDNLTGCEYLGRFLGGLTPRMDANGKQICRGAQ